MKTQRYFYFFLWDSELVLIFVVRYIHRGRYATKFNYFGYFIFVGLAYITVSYPRVKV